MPFDAAIRPGLAAVVDFLLDKRLSNMHYVRILYDFDRERQAVARLILQVHAGGDGEAVADVLCMAMGSGGQETWVNMGNPTRRVKEGEPAMAATATHLL